MAVIINGLKELLSDMEYYKKMFPETYTTIESIKETLSTDPYESEVGIEVSPEWEDKCYGFEIEKITPSGDVICEYLGIMKV